ncbi:MAG: hypothetical protein D8H99_20135 [Streptococcus sp.]|nr:MAG: hypothetical protein D8H99_20135 [Streptococcus sp.]
MIRGCKAIKKHFGTLPLSAFLTGACQRILFVSQSPAYNKLNKWFETYSDLYFSIIPLPNMGAYHELVDI